MYLILHCRRDSVGTLVLQGDQNLLVAGYPGDPIGGFFTRPIPYTKFDPLDQSYYPDVLSLEPGPGTGAHVWQVAPYGLQVGMRWEDALPSGDPNLAVWGGTPS